MTILPVTEKSLLKVFINTRSKRNKVSVRLQDMKGNSV
jgi:hypothetical protein